jgi:hypothetical protein
VRDVLSPERENNGGREERTSSAQGSLLAVAVDGWLLQETSRAIQTEEIDPVSAIIEGTGARVEGGEAFGDGEGRTLKPVFPIDLELSINR